MPKELPYKYKFSKSFFQTKEGKEGKEAYILECITRDITYILTYSKQQLGVTEKELLKISKRHLTSLIKQKNKIAIQKIKDHNKIL